MAASIAASATSVSSPHQDAAGANSTLASAMTRTVGADAAPVITTASQPEALSARARWLEESESLRNPVSGDLVTRAYFEVVVSPVPRKGLETKMSGFSGPSASTPGGAKR